MNTTHTGTDRRSRGFTLVEVLVVVGLMLLLLGIATQTLFSGQQRTSFTESVNQLVRDLRQQQIKVMQGATEGDGVLSDYSVRFESDRYILFPGSVYVAGNPKNQVVLLEPTVRFSVIDVPGTVITFARGSGEVRSYDGNSNSVVMSQTDTGSAVTVQFNRYGVVFTQ